MKAAFAKFIRSFTAVLCAIVWSTAIPLQMAFASYTAIPSGWWGCYDTTANPRYIIVISSKGKDIAFKGYMSDYGDISASYPSSIYFEPSIGGNKTNFIVTFEKRADYDPNKRTYVPADNGALFYANVNAQNSNILILNSGYSYLNPSDCDKYVMFA